MTAGTSQTVSVTATAGKGDTIKFASSNKAVLTVNKASAKASAKGIAKMDVKAVKEGTATLTVSSKNTGVKKAFKITVKAAAPAATNAPTVATTPGITTPTATVAATKAPSVATTPAVQTTAPAGTDAAATKDPSATVDPNATKDPNATQNPDVTEDPNATKDPNATPNPEATPNPATSASILAITAADTQGNEVDMNAAPVNGIIKVAFSEKVDANSVSSAGIKVYNATTNKAVSIPSSDITVEGDGQTVNVSLAQAGLEKNETYKIVVSNVKTRSGVVFATKEANFTIAATSVITKITLPGALDSVNDIQYNMGTGKDSFTIEYDTELDKETVSNTNIKLYNATTGTEMSMTPSLDNATGKGVITIQISSKFVDKTQYTVKLTGIKTALGASAENYTHNFTVNAATPMTGNKDFKTIDGVDLDGTKLIWPKTTSGLKEKYTSAGTTNYADKYYAGFQAVINVEVGLDADSVANNVLLVNKKTGKTVDTTTTYNKDARTITIVPTKDLEESTEYQIKFLGGLKSAEGIYLKPDKKTAVVDSLTKTFETFDVTSPVVEEIKAVNGDTGLNEKDIQQFEIKMSESVSLSEKNILITYSDANVETMLKNTANTGYVDPSNYSVSLKEGTTSTYVVKINAKTLKNDKAYKLRVIGKDMENIKLINETVDSVKHIGKKDEVVVVDKDLNSVKKTAMFAFSTSDKDTIKPFIKNAYAGDKVNPDNLISTTKTNVAKNAKFTFEFSEEIAIKDASKVVLQKLNGANWKDVSNGGAYHATSNPNPLTVTLTNASASSSINEAVVVELNETSMDDAKYRIYFKEGALEDKASTPNLSEEYKVEFIATYGNDDYASTNVKYGLCGYDASGNITSFTNGAGTIDAANTNGRIYVVFDETKLVAATDKNIVVKAGTEVVAGTLKEITVADSVTVFGLTGSASKTVYEFTPSKELKNDTAYTVTVSGVKDTAGNTIETKEFSFKTKKATNSVASITIAGTKAADGSDNYTNVDRQKTITIKLNDKPTAELKKAESITLTSTDDTGVASKYNVKKVSDTEYRVEFFNKDTDATTEPLTANTKYTLTVNPVGGTSTANQKVYTLVTGVTATDDLKPYKEKIEVNSKELIEYEGRLTFDDATNPLKITFNEKIDASDIKITAIGVNAGGHGENIGITVDGAVDSANNHVLVLSKLAAGRYDITISGVKDANGNVADDLTLKLNNDTTAYGKAETAKNNKEADNALSTAAGKLTTYFNGNTVDAITRTAALNTNSLAGGDVTNFTNDAKVKAAIADTKVTVTAVNENTADSTKWDIVLTSSGYTAYGRTTTITVAKSKVKFTTATLNTDARKITGAGANAVDISAQAGTTTEDKIAAKIQSALSLSSTVDSTVTAVTDTEGNVTGYTIKITDTTAADVSITAVLPVAAVKTTA